MNETGLRVLHVMADGAAGGGPTVVQTLCETLGRRGISSAIVTQANSHLLREAAVAETRVFGIDFSRRSRVLQVAWALKKLLRQERPDIVLAHGARSALPLAVLPRWARSPMVYVVHGFHYRHKTWKVQQLGRLVERLCIGRADCTVFVAKGDRAHAVETKLLGRARHALIRNGVAVPDDFARSEDTRAFDIAFVGRLHPQKDPLILPRILRALWPERPTMLIIASGELEAPLRAAIDAEGVGAQVTLLPSMPRLDALQRLAEARIFLLPSLWEGVPVSLAEAMLLRVTVVASAVGGNLEIVEDGVTGCVAPPGDPTAFADCIRRLLASPDERTSLADRGHTFVADTFSIDRQADAYLSLFRALV